MIVITGTLQELFDKTIEHLAQQKTRSVSEDNEFCMYRSKSGLKCAVGCHIKDEEYDPSIEGQSLTGLKNDGEIVFDNEETFYLMRSLQNVHDYDFRLDNLKGRLRCVAEKYNVNSDKVELITEWNP